MLYLKSIVLDKFKSFRHAELLFSKGFNCVVGPNGSGKSVIFDALMFGLGEPSLQTLRVDHLDELINRNIKRKKDEPTIAHLKMELEGDGKAVTIIKAIRSDGKTSYKLNDKTMTRKDIIEFLSSEGVRVGDTTTIAQGEINTIATLNNRERRQLIDAAAGISEYDDKKQEAMRELEKVDQNISLANATLHEREGYLRDLEKQKEAAESYQKMSSRIKNLRFSALSARQGQLKFANEAYSKELAILDSKNKDLSTRLSETKTKRDQLSEDSQKLASELNKITATSGETNSKLNVTNTELAKLEVEIPSIQKTMEENNVSITQSDAEQKASVEKVKLNKASIDELNKKIAVMLKEMEKYNIPDEGVDYEKELSELEQQINDGENKLVDTERYLSKLQADLSLNSDKKLELESTLSESEKQMSLAADRKKEKESEASKKKQEIVGMMSNIEKLRKEHSRLSKRLFEIDGERMDLAEQRARMQPREGNLAAKISSQFAEADGFYGRAASLCKYSTENAYAVEAAAGSRLEYFVVDSIAVASKIMDYLKKNGLGRATFIPIAEVNVRPMQKEKEITPVIDVVKFDAKFSKVFSYIFSDTFIIPTLNDAKKYGIGKHRYVTPGGELAEQSGIVSGGSSKKGLSLSSIENRIKELEDEKISTRKETDTAEASLNEVEKSKALLEMQVGNMESELKAISEELSRFVKRHAELAQQIKAKVDSEGRIRKEMEAKDKEKLEVITALNSGKQSRASIYEKVSAASKSLGKSGKNKAEKDKVEKLRQDVEASRISAAQLATETSMLETTASNLAYSISEKKKQIKELKTQLGEKELRREVLTKSKADIEADMSGKSTSSRKLIEKQNAINTEMNKLSMDIGKLESESVTLEKQVNELKLKKIQTETRFNDITAELSTSAYQSPDLVLIDGKPEEMDSEAAILSSKVAEMGAVNLKAPEVYEEMRKQTDLAIEKVTTLQSEKDAVLRMMEEIDSKKLQTFMDTLNQVNKNFAKLYNYVFPGKAAITLENEADPLNSGIYMKLNDGKSDIPLKSLSGGQKSMIALMLLFSIHLCKKSSMYLFDEVDAALDSENAKMLSKLIKQMSDAAQFIVISHNNSLIVNADTAIGVTMDTTKESKAIGLEIGSMIKGKPQ